MRTAVSAATGQVMFTVTIRVASAGSSSNSDWSPRAPTATITRSTGPPTRSKAAATAGPAVAAAFDAIGGPVDLVIVAVGALGDQSDFEDDPAEAARMITVNMTWPVAALTAVRTRLLAQGHGRVLVITSVAAVRVRRSMYLYAGAKAGLDRLCQGMSDSLVGTGVRLQLVRPGFVRTKMTGGQKEAPFTTGPNEVAEYVVRGLSTNAQVIWSPPVLRYLFVVVRHLPAALWRRVADL